MKHFTKLLSISALAMPLVLSAQVNVSTATTKRVAVVEEFTGNYCTACPLGHKEIETLYNKYPGKVVPLKIQYGGFSGTDPIFGGTLRTTDGDVIAVGQASNSYPNVKVSRVGSPIEGAGGSAFTAKENAIVNIINQNSPVNMYIEAAVDVTSRVMDISVEYYYTANEANATNYLHIGYYQDNIPAYQYNSNAYNPAKVFISEVELYEFDECFRANVTPLPSSGTWGDAITATTAGSTAIITKQITLPASFSTFALEAGAIKVFAYISKTDKGEIITATKAKPMFTNFPHADNVSIIYALSNADENCVDINGSLSPKILFGNKGGNALTKFTYEYGVNGAVNSNTWNGTLANSEKKAMTVPASNFTYIPSNQLLVELKDPNDTSDEDNTDNSLTTNFTGSTLVSDVTSVRIEAKVDSYGDTESTWKLRNSAGTVVQQSGKLEKSKVNVKEFSLPLGTDCYQFEILDTYGDGWGSNNYFRVYKTDFGANDLIMNVNASGNWKRKTAAGEFTSALSVQNLTNTSVKLYPNPTIGDATLEFNVSTLSTVTVDVVNTIGQKVISKNLGSVNGSQKITLESNQLESGLYFVTIKMGDNVLTQKLTVSK